MKNDYFSCPICQKMLPLKRDRNKKSYCICNDCGVQLFIRGKKGNRRLGVLLGNTKVTGDSKTGRYASYYLEFLEGKLESIRQNKLAFGKDADPKHQQETIENQIHKLHKSIVQGDFSQE